MHSYDQTIHNDTLTPTEILQQLTTSQYLHKYIHHNTVTPEKSHNNPQPSTTVKSLTMTHYPQEKFNNKQQ